MIDLHVHTNHSDGVDSVTELLKKAEKQKLEIISITDHDTCEAYNEIKNSNLRNLYSGILIPGVELKTTVNTCPIELLGYGVDTDIINEEVKKIYPKFEDRNMYEFRTLCNACKNLNIDIGENPEEEYNPKTMRYASNFIYDKIMLNPENKKHFLYEDSTVSANRFYRREVSNKDSKFYVDTSSLFPTVSQVIELIRKAGGLVFVPHIYVYRDKSKEIFKHITENYKVDGFECYYSRFSEEQTNEILQYCMENNLYTSGGSDYHGSFKPDIELAIGTR